VRRLLKEDLDIRVLQYHEHQALDGLQVETVIGDLNQPESLDRFCKGVDIVFHLAAKISIGQNSFDSLYKINVEGTQNLVASSKRAGVKRFIHFSSIHAYIHFPLDEPMDETRPLATDSKIAYERTKSIAQEWILKQQTDNFDVIVLNPTSIIGPVDYKPSLQGQFIMQVYDGKLPGLIPGGYDWVDVRDVCEAACNAIYQGKGGEKYILSGYYKSVTDFVKLIAQVTDRKIKLPVFPLWMAYMGVPFMFLWSKISGEKPLFTRQALDILQMGNRHIKNDKAKKELSYNPRPLAESLKDTISWLKENNYISA
ncbi:MAG: NAD-dependent epimerase/dehydratase family protein, partial [Cyclobacteriaceae bacterium]|nr:NAD-dependent epimerase/dehydratase family protein [Cyclobacteriaceae bacterium]